MIDSTIRVLLIEDDEDDYVITRELLSECQETYVVEWVQTYEEALEAMELHYADVCLVDYRLGKHDGLELLRTANERGFKAPLIILSGQDDYNVDVAAMKAGAVGYLVKGQVDGPMLARSIRYGIERKQGEMARGEQARALANSRASLEQFTYRVCQDIHAPLQLITDRIELLAQNYPDKLDPRSEALLDRAFEVVTYLQNFSAYLEDNAQAGGFVQNLQTAQAVE